MTITFPRQLPFDPAGMSECWFDLPDATVLSPSGKGLVINVSQVSDPVWKGMFESGILSRDNQAIWSAWHKSLKGGINTFITFDVRRLRPRAYPNANAPGDISGAWDGTVAVSALGLSGALSLADVPPGYLFKIGDRVGLEQSSKYGYYEVLEDTTASGGGTATITVTPNLHTGVFTTSAVCRLWRPWCQFVIDPQSWVEQGGFEITPINFAGFQRL